MTGQEKKPLVIGLAGLGVVGGGLASLIAENREIIRRHTGRDIFIKKILERDATRAKALPLDEKTEIVNDFHLITEDPEIEAIVELMGGIEPATTLIRSALENKKHVVTANKALLAENGQELFALARKNYLILRHEASVAGAIPIIQSLRESLVGNRINHLTGILNGTSNYILSEMANNGLEFDIALKQAQELGYAEANPTLDIDGHDAAHKLILLIRLAYGVHCPLANLPVQGIRGISSLDISMAGEFGYKIRLLGQVRDISAGTDAPTRLEAGVFPALVHKSYLLASVEGVFNAVLVNGNASGDLFFHGRGAGSKPTAGAVLADIMAVARDENTNNTGFMDAALPPADMLPPEEWRSSYYLRAMVEDSPGVLRDISGCLAAEGISVAQVIQKPVSDKVVPLVFMTHETTASAMQNAMARTTAAGLLTQEPVLFRVIG